MHSPFVVGTIYCRGTFASRSCPVKLMYSSVLFASGCIVQYSEAHFRALPTGKKQDHAKCTLVHSLAAPVKCKSNQKHHLLRKEYIFGHSATYIGKLSETSDILAALGVNQAADSLKVIFW